MLITKEVIIKLNNRNIEHYKKILNNDKLNINDNVNVSIEDVTKGSHVEVVVQCDECGLEKKMLYKTFNRYIGGYYCTKCVKKIKTKKTMNEIYGVDVPLQNKSIKEKFLITCKLKYGVEYPIQNKNILDKRNKTNLEKYGTEHVSLNNNIRNKQTLTKITNIIDKLLDDKFLNYDFNSKTIQLKCVKGHIYKTDYQTIYNRIKYNSVVCNVCNPIGHFSSDSENRLLEFFKENYDDEIIEKDRDILNGKELDIYLPDLNLAFEFNGVYWHNELYKDKNYHLNKTEKCLEKGIQLIHIWEDDWNYKQEIIKSMILNKLGKTQNKIYARKCEIKEIKDNKLIREFLIKNHIQGFVGSLIKLGLFYENELVSLMTFGKKRKFMNSNSKDGEYELLRFCNKLNTNVIGGASKLFTYFSKKYSFREITTYADRSYSNGKLYGTIGFTFISKTQPNYYYVVDGVRKHRFGFRKDVLIKEGYDVNTTEHEIMLKRKIYRIYDSGSLKFIKLP